MKGGWFSKLQPIEKGIVILVGIVIFYCLQHLIRAYFQNITSKAEQLGEVAALQSQGMQKSYPDSQYTQFANTLYEAMYGAGTDDDTILVVFGRMNNDLDVLTLENKFGLKPDWKNSQYNLQQWLRGEGTGITQNVNNLLASKGISKSF